MSQPSDRAGGLWDRWWTAPLAGLGSGVAYGLCVRGLLMHTLSFGAFLALSYAFMIVLPAVVGYLSVAPSPQPSWAMRISFPWMPCSVMLAAAFLLAWEGSIGVVMALPVMLIASSAGGLVAGAGRQRKGATVVAIAPPLLLHPVGARWPSPVQPRSATTAIEIRAPRGRVWDHVVEVRRIEEGEFRPRFIHRIGLPRPIAAVLTGKGVGAVRRATFAGGVRFTETVFEWDEGRELAFSIRPNTAEIPAVTLDEHVVVGGGYFDVLEGRYHLDALSPGVTRLVLTSRYRVSTHLNFYAGPWSDLIMRSIQESILEVIRQRCERAAPEDGETGPRAGHLWRPDREPSPLPGEPPLTARWTSSRSAAGRARCADRRAADRWRAGT